jgi:uncharacterized protein YrrD
MYILSAQLKRLGVLSLQTGQSVATTTEPIIDPANLTVVALGLAMPQTTQPVIMTADVRQLARDCVVIDSQDEISEAGEIVRLDQLLAQNFKLIDLPVFTESGRRLGKVEDFTMEVETYRIKKVYVKRPLLLSIAASNLVIDRDQVIEATPRQLTVSEAWVKKGLLVPASKPVKS